MRQIKFRAWNRNSKELYADMLVGAAHDGTPLNNLFKVDDVIFMQYTGLKDKNGVEIYEGDIVQHNPHWSNGAIKSTVRWDEDSAEFRPFGNSDWALDQSEVEVIGNIYENPELLK